MSDMTAIEKAKEACDSIESIDHNSCIITEKVNEIREAIAALEAEKPAEEDAEDVDSASWAFMSVTEMDEGFPERRERMKILIGRRDEKIRESYHAKQCIHCQKIVYCEKCGDPIFVGYCENCIPEAE